MDGAGNGSPLWPGGCVVIDGDVEGSEDGQHWHCQVLGIHPW